MGSIYDGLVRRIGCHDVCGRCRFDVVAHAAAGIRVMAYLTTLFYITIGCIAGYVAGTLITVWAYRDEIGGYDLESRDLCE